MWCVNFRASSGEGHIVESEIIRDNHYNVRLDPFAAASVGNSKNISGIAFDANADRQQPGVMLRGAACVRTTDGPTAGREAL